MKKNLAILVCTIFLAGCSVNKAADLDGASVEDLAKCKDKGCFLGLGSHELESKAEPDGTTSVVYTVKRRNGNLARALAYGAADTFTLGLWEIVGTPLENHISDKDSIVYKVIYAPNGAVNKVEIQGN